MRWTSPCILWMPCRSGSGLELRIEGDRSGGGRPAWWLFRRDAVTSMASAILKDPDAAASRRNSRQWMRDISGVQVHEIRKEPSGDGNGTGLRGKVATAWIGPDSPGSSVRRLREGLLPANQPAGDMPPRPIWPLVTPQPETDHARSFIFGPFSLHQSGGVLFNEINQATCHLIETHRFTG